MASAAAATDQQAADEGEAAAGETAPARSLDEEGAEDGSAWFATREWPPAGAATRRFSFDGGPSKSVESVNDGVLTIVAAGDGATAGAAAPAVAEGTDRYQVDYTSSMGTFSRWMNGYGSRRQEPARTTFFDERTAEDRKALTWTSPPLTESMTIVGYPVVHLVMSSTHSDGDVFVYLEEVDENGAAHYVSEGALRASSRKTDPPAWPNFGLPFHRSTAADLQPLTPGEPTTLDFDLEGTAITIDAGHRVRITLAGADKANYELWPDTEGKDRPTVTVHRGGDQASWLELPVMSRGTT
jgi:hypothetical protein